MIYVALSDLGFLLERVIRVQPLEDKTGIELEGGVVLKTKDSLEEVHKAIHRAKSGRV